MIRGNNHITTARIAICAALLCGTSAAFAQEAAVAPTVQAAPSPPVAAPVVAQPAPEADTVVAPPPVVATIPEEQLVKPAAAERPASRRATARATPVRSEAAPAAPVTASTTDPTESLVAPIEETLPPTATIEDAAAIAPVAPDETIAPVDGAGENMLIVGGIAAALGLAGIGAVLARRRRRPVEQYAVTERTETVVPVVPAAPIFAAPVAVAELTRPAVVEHTAPRFVPAMADRNLPPVTDPLFAHRAELGPVTDPLFAHKVDLPPVTDPMFADHDEYAGKTPAGSVFDTRRTWPATQTQRELEPAE